MKRVVVAVAGLAVMTGGCAARQPPAPPPVKVAIARSSKAVAETPTGAEILAAQPARVRDAVREHAERGEWPVYRTAAFVLFPYGEGAPPVVDCAPLRTTDIQLQAGETITDVAMGDTERWMATPAASGDPRNSMPHLAVKPQQARIETNLAIYTTKHIYHLLLHSRGRAMQEVEFYYPDELLAQMAAADQAPAKGVEEATADLLDDSGDSGAVVKVAAVDPAQLNFSYKVEGPNAPFRPLRAFDDGRHVYIQMAPGMKTSEAPALLIAASGGEQMVNYRVDGDYYVVDRLFNRAVLVDGVGRAQDRMTIAYTGGSR